MPDKGLTVATYAAGASLAAITLVYVFAPTYFIDNSENASSTRKKGVVGLHNPANDCFINSVLQALAGLGDLRLYLIRETHRRALDSAVYERAVPQPAVDGNGDPKRQIPEWKLEGLQAGLATKGLKDILDALNERPIYKKTISAASFVRVLEVAFRQRISRQQQDAQEFLQVVAERLCDEYHAGRNARLHAAVATDHVGQADGEPVNGELVGKRLAGLAIENGDAQSLRSSAQQVPAIQTWDGEGRGRDEEEDGFPMEGRYESQIECLTCGFKPRPNPSTFCTLTLHVPQKSTSLNACFDGMFKVETIDDFKCEKCRLQHAVSVYQAELAKATSANARARAEEAIAKLQHAVDTDPELPPLDVALPEIGLAPKRTIRRHIRLTHFPKIMSVHLSRSIYDANQMSMKNSAKVSFPERLPLGGLLSQKKYKLLGLVTHKGSHYSGHYESFRRQNVYPPYSNANTFQPAGAYSKAPSPAGTPQMAATPIPGASVSASPLHSTPDLLSPVSVTPPTIPSPLLDGAGGTRLRTKSDSISSLGRGSLGSLPPAPTSAPPTSVGPQQVKAAPKDSGEALSLRSTKSVAASAKSVLSKLSPHKSNGSIRASDTSMAKPVAAPVEALNGAALGSGGDGAKKKTGKKQRERWWRISDEKVKEASTRDVLGLQREVYLLFYELERDG